jgi:crotonobetainyl-CoA:carnitine CoA-transferase CaiB-like acyl-CoA transferase
MAHLKELEVELSQRFRTQTRDHWLAALEAKGVPCGPVNDMLQALSDPQTLAREMVVEVAHSTLGPVKTIGLPVKFSETPGKVRVGAPLYGEHTRDVLGEYGFDDEQIDAFEREGAIFATAAPTKAGQQVA